MSFIVLNCQVVEGVDIFANPVFKNPRIHTYFIDFALGGFSKTTKKVKIYYSKNLLQIRLKYLQ